MSEPECTGAKATVELLDSLGIRRVYGVTGGPIAPLCDALGRSALEALHCRHESGAGFAALEDSLASGEPCAVFVTTGPGITNALTGMCAARSEGGRVLLLSAVTPDHEIGRRAFQETSPRTLPQDGLFRAGPIFHDAFRLAHAADLPEIARSLARGFSRPGGYVAHLTTTYAAQKAPCAPVRAAVRPAIDRCDPALADAAAQILAGREFGIWIGAGAHGAAREIAKLAERTGAAVMSSPRGKGAFPEDHPQYAGVTGFGGHARVKEYLSQVHPEVVLVLGTRLGEFTSFFDPDLVPPGGFVHVDLDLEAAGAAYPGSVALAVAADTGSFVRALLERIDARPGAPAWTAPADDPPAPGPSRGPVRPQALLQAVQRCVVDRTDAIVLSEAGNAFAWATHALRFRAPGRYRTSTGWGAMGHATCGVIGAARGRRGPAVALVGDGAMLMQSELSTAVRYRIPAAWIVLNDSGYGMIEQGMRALGLRPLETALPETDFAAFARALGAEGVRVERESELDAALSRVASLRGPLVVDVTTDPAQPAPFLRRVQSLIEQTTHSRTEAEP
jgi:acetolactate synthase-1/2/3 large subunit